MGIHPNFIGGRWIEASAAAPNVNPSNTGDIVGEYARGTRADANNAIEAAKAAFQAWSRSSPQLRYDALKKVSDEILSRKDELGRLLAREEGKIFAEGVGEVVRAGQVFAFFSGEALRIAGEKLASVRPNIDVEITREPLGVVGLITPWNFPIAIPSWKLIPALVCGNTVVIKPASESPLSCYHLVKVCQEVGIPRGVVNYVTGGGESAGTPLTRHPGVSLISFTGSSETGRQVSLACAETFKRVSLEMGGKNAMIVMDDARLDLAVEGALWGAFATTGQRCTATSRIIVHKKVHKEFVDRLVERATALKVGDGLDESVDVGPVISEAQLKKVMDYVQIGRDEGADPVLGGVRLTKNEYGRGFFFPPTIFTGVTRGMRIAKEEIFGPVVCVLAADGLDDALEIANDSLYGLSSSIYTQDVNRAFVAVRELETGITYVNSSTIGAETHLPFGGMRRSGNGHREGAGHTAIDIFSEWKTVYVDYSGKLQKAQIDNN